MTEAQRARVEQTKPDSLWRIPDGSWFAVRRDERGTWVEVIDPVASGLLAFDFPEGDDPGDRQPSAGTLPRVEQWR
jgi:hypothetical protein